MGEGLVLYEMVPRCNGHAAFVAASNKSTHSHVHFASHDAALCRRRWRPLSSSTVPRPPHPAPPSGRALQVGMGVPVADWHNWIVGLLALLSLPARLCIPVPPVCTAASSPPASPLLLSIRHHPATEFLRDAYGGAVRDLSARLEERRKAEAAAAAQAAEVARLQAQAAEQRLASAESEGNQLRTRLGEAERRLGEVQAELAQERERGAAAAAQLARLEQQVAHLEQSKAAESRNLSQAAEAQLRAAQAAHQAEVAQLSAASAEAARRASEVQQQLTAAQAELAALQQQAVASGAAAQDVQGRLAALAAERDTLSDSLQVGVGNAEALGGVAWKKQASGGQH